MKLKRVIYTFLLVIAICSCRSERDRRLHATLEQAGENRIQLEQVLEHYRDSGLKYRAACYLIENMYDCYYYNDSRIDSLKKLKSMSLDNISDEWNASVSERWNGFSYKATDKIYDSRTITAEYLIDNIERSFDVWQSRPWSKYYSFDDFCKYILPYRIGDEPLEWWRETYYTKYASAIDSIYTGSDVVKVVQAVRSKFLADGFSWNTKFSLPHLGASFLLKYRTGECRESCDLTVYILRSLGIPVGTDCYLASPYTNGAHSWTVLKDTTGGIVPFWLAETEVRRGGSDGRPKGKVYRQMYWGELEDVTSEYFGENKAEIEIDCPDKVNEVYLGIFSCGKYTPVAKAPLHNCKATFCNIEPGIRFQPMYKDIETLSFYPAGYAFSIDSKGMINYYIPDTIHRHKARMMRKYPAHAHLSYMQDMAGTRIDGSTSSVFRNAIYLCSIPDTICSNNILMYPQSSSQSRFVRFTTPADKFADLAEVEFYVRKSDTVPVPYKISMCPREKNSDVAPCKMNDGDILSYFSAKDKGSCQIVFDLGTCHHIEKIRFVPRNDDNFIRSGDKYELFYHAGIYGWKSLGQKVATSYSMEYDNVPQGALLWLHDITRGREEQAFIIMNDGNQFFYDRDL